MKCLLKYRWVKLPRAQLPQGKGVLGYWSRLAARAAFRKGTACYCGYHNEVVPGMWSGGIVGLKSILGVRRRAQALQIMDQLQSLGYIKYSLDQKTKRLDYQICDWVISCSGQGCSAGTVYATDGYGFLCLPRNITQRLVKHNYKFEEADALLDLWCHTTWQDSRNAFSFLAPAVQFGEYGAVLTLEYLGQRWGWERTEEQQIQEKSDAFIRILTQRGILGNDQIKDERIRQAQQEKQRRMYHNTRLLLEQYRNIAWALECFPDTIAAELDHPLGDLDSLLGKMDLEMGLGNRKLESRLESVKKSRLLLDRVNEALTVLKRKPDNGPKMYELIYQTYLAPEKLSHADLLYRLDISSRHYYRLRQQAITILSIRLWSAPSNEVDSWLEILTLLESL